MMNDNKEKPETPINKQETVKELKEQAVDPEEVKKGYNERNPAQPHGAFPPDTDNSTE
jgi:hypothetical protein